MPSRIARTIGLLLGLVVLWIFMTATILLVTDEAEAVTVIFPSKALMNGLPHGVYVLEWDGPTALLKGTVEGYVAALYRHGAILVLPARAASCVTLLPVDAAAIARPLDMPHDIRAAL